MSNCDDLWWMLQTKSPAVWGLIRQGTLLGAMEHHHMMFCMVLICATAPHRSPFHHNTPRPIPPNLACMLSILEWSCRFTFDSVSAPLLSRPLGSNATLWSLSAAPPAVAPPAAAFCISSLHHGGLRVCLSFSQPCFMDSLFPLCIAVPPAWHLLSLGNASIELRLTLQKSLCYTLRANHCLFPRMPAG